MFKIMKYILKNTLLKIRNIKTITFAIIIAVTIWSYNHPLRELTYSIKYPVMVRISFYDFKFVFFDTFLVRNNLYKFRYSIYAAQ